MTHLIRREDLFAPIEQHFNKMFYRMFGSDGLQTVRDNFGRSNYPKLDVLVSDGRYIVECAVPGVKPEDVKVEILPLDDKSLFGIDHTTSRMLKISGKMSRDYQYSKNVDYAVKELRRSYFERSMIIPDDIKDDPEAVIENGILRLTWPLPASLKAEAKVIEVKQV